MTTNISITEILNKLIQDKATTIVIGVSAGPDSMALLHYMHTNTKFKIVCAHINHNIRKESKEEENYLRTYCKINNIIFEHMKIDTYSGKNFENEARTKRYKFYKQVMQKYNTPYLFLAHHGDDLIETILMKIARGSNLEGYAGIKEISKVDNYYIIRPFLKYTKEDLINYNKQNKIKYYIDNSNQDTTYTRNRYRKNILPLLKEEDKNIHQKYLKYSKTLLEYQSFIDEITAPLIEKVYKNDKNTIDLTFFQTIHPFLQKNILYKILNSYYNNEPNLIKEKHIQSILNIADSSSPNLKLTLPNNTIIQKSYMTLTITKNNSYQTNYKIPLEKTTKVPNIPNITIKYIDDTDEDGNDICRLNSKELKLPLYIRCRKSGDIIDQKGLNGHKKVKEIFIEKKVPLTLRNTYPILVDSDDNIIWLPNLKKTKFNKQKKDFYDIILRYYEKEEKNE